MPDPEPCPFCGSTDVKINESGFSATVTCRECEAEGPDGGIAAWNRRVHPAPGVPWVIVGPAMPGGLSPRGGTVDDWPGTRVREIDDEVS